jgi:hypothetical protein
MLRVKTFLLALLVQIPVTEVRAEPWACYTHFGDVRFTSVNNRPFLLPYNQCLSYLGRDGAYILGRADWGSATAEGRIFAGDVYCGPGSCRRPFSRREY